MKKLTRTALTKKLDKLMGEKVRSRGRCERCGKQENLQWSHIISRTYKSIRWDEQNALCLCAGCHMFWWHKEPIEAARWLEEKWPGRYDEINAKRNQIVKVDLESLLEQLQK